MAPGVDMTAVFVLAGGLVGTRVSALRLATVAAAALALTELPALLVPVIGLAAGRSIYDRLRTKARDAKNLQRDLALLAELVAIGLTGGLGIQPSLALAAETVGGRVGGDAEAVLRRVRIDGLGACVSSRGIGAVLYRAIGRTAASGAPLLDPVSRIADELHADLAAARLQAVRRLPVSMLFPLTLLILPGFLMLTVAPALLDAFGRLEI